MGLKIYAFEGIEEAELRFMPLAVRRALDEVGLKLSLPAWSSLSVGDRASLAAAGGASEIDQGAVRAVLSRALPVAAPCAAHRVDAAEPPRELVGALGASRSIDGATWRALSPLDRYVLAKCAAKPEKLARAYDAIVAKSAGEPAFAHLDEKGQARMVDVAAKTPTVRRAVASACITMTPSVLASIVQGDSPKGDVLAVARIAGIQAAKRTPELIPLCHAVALTRVDVAFEVDAPSGVVRVRAQADAIDRTGVEMEALVAASVAALTLYDMVKSADRWMTIGDVCLQEKSGGRSGNLKRPSE